MHMPRHRMMFSALLTLGGLAEVAARPEPPTPQTGPEAAKEFEPSEHDKAKMTAAAERRARRMARGQSV